MSKLKVKVPSTLIAKIVQAASRHESEEDQLRAVFDLEPDLSPAEREACEVIGWEVLLAIAAKTDLLDHQLQHTEFI